MNIDYTRDIFILTYLLVFGVGMTSLQIFLSRKASRWLGFILPIITFSVSLLFVASIVPMEALFAVATMSKALALLICNMPTVILLVIYTAYTKQRNRQRAFRALRASDRINAPDINNLMITLARG